MADDVLSLPDAERLGADLNRRIIARASDEGWEVTWDEIAPFMLARVESDLAGLRDCYETPALAWGSHARRYSDGLRATAALYPKVSDTGTVGPASVSPDPMRSDE